MVYFKEYVITYYLMLIVLMLIMLIDKHYILKKCPYLLNEMISTANQLFFYDQAGRGIIILQYSISIVPPVPTAPCGLRGCKNTPTPFPGRMS